MKRKGKEVAEEVVKKAKKTPAAPAFIARTPLGQSKQLVKKQKGMKTCHIMCWNVAGLRGCLKKKESVFDELVQKYSPHIICLQETKLQQTHEKDFKELLPGYAQFWASSTAKKGYSGTALFLKDTIAMSDDMRQNNCHTTPAKSQKSISSFFGGNANANESKSKSKARSNKKAGNHSDATAAGDDANASMPLQLLDVRFELEDKRFSGEGRTITAEFDKFFLVNCYVPNSGQTLDRLDYRTKEWDPYLYQYLKKLEEKKPVIFTGDLNVAHLDLDIHNPHAKHLVKQAGVTPQERESFGSLLATGFQDALRYFYPDHEGQFTYWSQRTNARPVNKGLRLDYFMCSRGMFAESLEKEEDDCSGNEGDLSLIVEDSTILHDEGEGCSDHCPILLTLSIA